MAAGSSPIKFAQHLIVFILSEIDIRIDAKNFRFKYRLQNNLIHESLLEWAPEHEPSITVNVFSMSSKSIDD